MVALDQEAKDKLQWWIHDLHQWNGRDITPSPLNLTILTPRLGSCLQWDQNGRPLVNAREGPTYQQLRAPGRSICGQSVYKAEEQHSGPTTNGQQHSSRICEQDGGDTLTGLVPSSLPTMAMVPSERNPFSGRTPSRSLKHSGGPGVKASGVISGMDATQRGVPHDPTGIRSLPGGSFCNQIEPSTSEVYQLETGPICPKNRCSPVELEVPGRICIPSLLPDREVPAKDSAGTEYCHNGSATVACTSVVSGIDGEPGGLSPVSPKSQRSAAESTQSSSPLDNPRLPATTRLQSIRKHHTASGVSEKASQLLLAGWSKGTNTAYESGWGKWSCKRKVDPISCSIQPFLDFLTDLYDQGLQYRSINLIRSAVSMTHNNIEAAPIGQHPLVSRIMRGIYNLRPLYHSMIPPGM